MKSQVVTAESHGRSTLQSPIANRTRTRSITKNEPSSKGRKPRARSRKLVSPRPSPKKLQSAKPQPANRRKTPTPQPIVEPVVEEQSSEDDPNDSLQSESTINSSLNSEDLEEENIIANISPETENTNSHTMYTAPEHSQVRLFQFKLQKIQFILASKLHSIIRRTHGIRSILFYQAYSPS